VALTATTPRAAQVDALFGFGGAGAWISYWQAGTGTWGPQQSLEMGAVNDAAAMANSPYLGALIYATPGAIKEVVYNPGSGMFEPAAVSYPASEFPGITGELVSAASKTLTRGFLVVSGGTPGQLWFRDRTPGGTATLIGNVGDSPHEIRARGTFWAVSNTGSSTLTFGSWSASEIITIRETVPVGTMPMGLNIDYLSSNERLVACSGYGDDTWTVCVVSTLTDSLISKTTQPLPAGCTKPVDVKWVYIPVRRLVVTCEGSSNVAIVDTGF